MTRDEIIKALRQFINQVDWVSVNKKLPCDELRCRVVLNGDFSCDYPATYRAYDPGPGFGRFNWDDYEYHFYSNVTHWKEQPLYNAKDLCRAAADLLEQDAPSWISVKDKLPEMSGYYLVCTHNTFYDTYCISKVYFSGGMWGSLRKRYTNVTHWMPLPKPPKENGGMKNDG